MSPPQRVGDVALSAPALAHQWARQESAPHGAVVVAHREIAARGRGGQEWVEDDALAVSVVVRPTEVAPSAAEVGWLAAGLAAAETLGTEPTLGLFGLIGPDAASLWWPDQVVVTNVDGDKGRDTDVSLVRTSVLAESILGPGRVEYAVLTVRFASSALRNTRGRDPLAAAMVASLQHWADRLNDPADVVSAYRERCRTLGQLVAVDRSTGGAVRGTAVDITEDGALVLRSPTGLDEIVTVGATRLVTAL